MLNDVLVQLLKATKYTDASLLKAGESGVFLETVQRVQCKQQARV